MDHRSYKQKRAIALIKPAIFSMEKSISIKDITSFLVHSHVNNTGDAIHLTMPSKSLWICEIYVYGISGKQMLGLFLKSVTQFIDIFNFQMSADLQKFPFTDTWISTNRQRCTVAIPVISCNPIRLPGPALTVNGTATNHFASLICIPMIRPMKRPMSP